MKETETDLCAKWTDETYICDFCGNVQLKEKPCGKCGHLWLTHPTTATQKAHNATLRDKDFAMNVTPTMMRVLRRLEERDSCGVNSMADVIFLGTRRHMSLRAAQYMGRLAKRGLVQKQYDFIGASGSYISYRLTTLARDILRSER